MEQFTTTYGPLGLALLGIIVMVADIWFNTIRKNEVLGWFILVVGGVIFMTGMNWYSMQVHGAFFIFTFLVTLVCCLLGLVVTFLFPIPRGYRWGYVACILFNLVILLIGTSRYIQVSFVTG